MPSFISTGLTIDPPVIDLSGNPLDVYREFDPKIVESYNRLQDLVFSEGALPQKFKVIDSHGNRRGAWSISGCHSLGSKSP
jgi:hypothetical protein